jgi:CRP/FNR family transcriptional regulator, cyclic AMP receptor protein
MSDEFDRVEALQASPLFANMLPLEKQYLADLAVRRDLRAGEMLFDLGSIGEAVYIVVSGALRVLVPSKGGEMTVVATLSAPDFLGEMALIDRQPRAARVEAVEDTVLLAVSHDNIYSFAKVYRNGFTWLVVNIAKGLSARLRAMNKNL